jgi:penicillin-binding protein 1B
VWVGFDDNRELGLEGSKSALPIWTEFMKRAHKLRGYENPKGFASPRGLVRVAVDADTGLLAGPDCEASTEYFISGTQPGAHCSHHDPVYEAEILDAAHRTTPAAAAADALPQR